MTVYCPWYPNKIGVEGNSYLVYIFVCYIKIFIHSFLGTYLLKTLPEVIKNFKDISPREFDEKGTDNIVECLSEIRKTLSVKVK